MSEPSPARRSYPAFHSDETIARARADAEREGLLGPYRRHEERPLVPLADSTAPKAKEFLFAIESLLCRYGRLAHIRTACGSAAAGVCCPIAFASVSC